MDSPDSCTLSCAGFLMPHPPVLVPKIGKGREREARKTGEACDRVAALIAEFAPDTIVVISPHAPLFRDYLYVYDSPELTGSFVDFGAPDIRYTFPQDSRLRAIFAQGLRDAEIPAGSLTGSRSSFRSADGDLDHGVLVPLSFIREAYDDFRLLALSSSAFDPATTLKVGALLGKAIVESGSRVCIVASGDMSHKVNAESPYGMVKEGALFDREICRAFSSSSLADVLSIDPDLRAAAAECGYNSIVMMCGALGLESCSSSLVSYEAPFGIGYCVAECRPGRDK
jgi:aromatic ring-opening dioxygenase LigB subunit